MKAEKVSIFILLFFLIVFLCVFFAPCALSQTVSFGYDAAGNRISGKTIVMLRAQAEEEQEEAPTGYSELLSERIVRIYPNPTQGLLKIGIENLADEKAVIALYDMSGRRIAVREGVSDSTELDITSQPDGIYILKIVIGEEESEWKVIKH